MNASDELLNDAVVNSFFDGCGELCEHVMDGLADCAGYARLVDMIRDLQTASGFAHFKDLLRALDEGQAAVVLPSALVSEAAWNKLLEEFWRMLYDVRHERHNLTEQELHAVFESIRKNRKRFIQHLQWLCGPMCRQLAN